MAVLTRANKLFIGVNDSTNADRKQLSVISSLNADGTVYLNQYAKIFTEDEIGSFDIVVTGSTAILQFSPIDGNINNYIYNFISYDLKKYITDTGFYDFGNSINVFSNNTAIGIGSTEVISLIDSNASSLKFIIEVSSETDKDYEYNEINLIIKDNQAYISEYGRITVSDNPEKQSIGIGTYGVSFSTSTPELVFYPNFNQALTCNLNCISISNPNFNSTKNYKLRYSDIRSENTSIFASDSPSPVVISSYTSDYNFGYFIVQITDTTNNEIQLSELLILNTEIECNIIEYGNVYTNNSLGTFDCFSASITELLFTPNKNIDVDIKLLHHSTRKIEISNLPISLDLENSEIKSGFSDYSRSSSDNLKKSFNLTHKNIPIFKRRFNGSTQVISQTELGVDLNKNLVYLPNNFFKSGEKIIYSSNIFDYFNILTSSTTSVSGIGTDIVNVDNTIGVISGDFLNFNNDKKEILTVTPSSVKLVTELDYEISVGSAVTFSRLSEFITDVSSTESAIGIAQTYISGVGVTDKLSGELYAYVLNDSFVGFCTSPIDALSTPPKLLDLTSVGLGDNHYITSTNQNSKCLISIDNVIQAPISLTPIETTLQTDLTLGDNLVYTTGISSFFSGDIIKIDDEIMKINYSSVGIGNSLIVERSFLGSNISTHSSGAKVIKLKGNYNIIDNIIHFSSSPYGPIYDNVKGDINIRSKFQGRVFTRSGIPDTNLETYDSNRIFDDISEKFNAIEKNFKLESSNTSITGISTWNSIVLINNIFQSPEVDYNLSEQGSDTILNFTGTATSALYDPNNSSVPRGGLIVSVGSSNGYGYQPLVCAGGTAVVSISGTIQSISIGNSGSGYRPGLQTMINVGVQTLGVNNPNIEYIGIASVLNGNIVGVSITNPGSGYDQSNPPIVVFDHPLSYSNLELKYYGGNTGVGSQAKIDIVVGQGSSIIDFTITNYGYSYEVGDILTIDSGGLSGIPIDSTKPFSPFILKVERVFTDNFNSWSIGELQKIDDIDHLFDGSRKKFPISDNGTKFAIISRDGSQIDLNAVLLIFINDVLQEPEVAYKFTGGSNIEFTEAPKSGAKCRILFYKGTTGIDVIDRDIVETIKIGDKVEIIGNSLELIQNERVVSDILLPDTLETLPYNSTGVTSDLSLLRPIVWCKQKEDIVINGTNISKSRVNYDSNIFPTCNLIQPISIGQTQIYVDGIKSLFDPKNENTEYDVISAIEILDNTNLIPAIGTAIVSASGNIESIVLNNSGYGYESPPSISIQPPINSLGIATISSTILNKKISTISIDYPGFGYTFTNPPLVLIEPPKSHVQYIKDINYTGDHGIITGVKQINVGYANTGLVFDLYIPQDSELRNLLITDPDIVTSNIKENYYFKVSNSNIGSGVTSLRLDGSIIGIGTTGIDNIYQAISVSYASTDVYGVGTDNVVQVVVSISSYDGISGFGYSSYYGEYSWGLIDIEAAQSEYNLNSDYGIVGLNSTPTIRRYNRYRTTNYSDS